MSESTLNYLLTSNPAREKPQFPEGLRVLAVDDNEVCLKVIEAQLIKCRFIVTVTTKATEALEMLRKNKESYDIVITDVEMPDMNGFKLLEIIGLEMDMPVIMMSASDDTQTVMKGIRHGARDYLTKPVRLAEVKNIWQHVLRKNLPDHPTKLGTIKEGKDQNLVPSTTRKQRGKEKEEETNAQFDEESSRTRKPRLQWTKELHNKFLDAVQQMGINGFPKKILEKMNDPRLSRENKYRNSIKKAKMNPESEKSNTDLSKTIMHLPNPTPISVGIPSFDTQYRTFGAFPANNGRPQLYNQNQQQISLPQNLVPWQVADQTRSTVPVPAPIFVQNSSSETELDWTRCPSNFSRPKMVNSHCIECSPHFPIFNAGRFGPTTMPNVPYSCPPSGAFNLAGVPFQGQYEGRDNLVNFNGRGESTITQFVKHPSEISERESNGLDNNYDYPDDDLSFMALFIRAFISQHSFAIGNHHGPSFVKGSSPSPAPSEPEPVPRR
ncbi:hypothetical protein RHSIM_Rhsim03G0263800 [Rhododendron simsii]|uniref:Response regulatory domain-containing protein n=1 Tax=Rhododendron simsii TaxID=118357 RepID=A0A834H8J1_RHOSS|nr:hypothetical protein RHSIM_Rhsim03G0263800 [Rhododendron simsii]